MMAYRTTAPVILDPILTLISLLAVIGIAAPGLALAAGRRRWSGAVGGAVIGTGISVMHYVGMAAYRVDGIVTWNTPYVVASILLSSSLSAIAFHVLAGKGAGGTRRRCMAEPCRRGAPLHWHDGDEDHRPEARPGPVGHDHGDAGDHDDGRHAHHRRMRGDQRPDRRSYPIGNLSPPASHGPARQPDRPAQPHQLHRGSGGPFRHPGRLSAYGGRHDGPVTLQGGQRYLWPSGGRPIAGGARGPLFVHPAARRTHRPAGRRRVFGVVSYDDRPNSTISWTD